MIYHTITFESHSSTFLRIILPISCFMSISVLFSDITYVIFIKLYDNPVFNANFTVRLVKLVDVILYKLVVRETQYMYIKSTVPLNVFVFTGILMRKQ